MKRKQDMWTLDFRPDQVDLLRLLIDESLKEVNNLNKDWLPSRIATAALLEMRDYINNQTG